MIIKKLMVPLEKYTDASGQEKTKWLQIGAIHTTRDGSREYMTLDPHISLQGLPQSNIEKGDKRVYVSMFDNDRETGTQGASRPSQGAQKDLNEPLGDSEVPF